MKKCQYINILKQDAEGEKVTHLHTITKDRFLIQVKFSMPGDKFHLETMWIEDLMGTTPQELADSLQGWVDKLRTL